MKYIDKALEVIEKVCTAIAAALLMWMLFALSVQVIARFVFSSGYSWTEESARYTMIWMVFVGAVVVTKRGMHVVVDAVEEAFPKTVPVLKVIQYLIMLVYCGIVCYFSVKNLANAARQTSPNMNIPMNYVYLVFPFSMVLIALYTLRHLIAVFRKEKYGVVASEVEEALQAVESEMKEADSK